MHLYGIGDDCIHKPGDLCRAAISCVTNNARILSEAIKLPSVGMLTADLAEAVRSS